MVKFHFIQSFTLEDIKKLNKVNYVPMLILLIILVLINLVYILTFHDLSILKISWPFIFVIAFLIFNIAVNMKKFNVEYLKSIEPVNNLEVDVTFDEEFMIKMEQKEEVINSYDKRRISTIYKVIETNDALQIFLNARLVLTLKKIHMTVGSIEELRLIFNNNHIKYQINNK